MPSYTRDHPLAQPIGSLSIPLAKRIPYPEGPIGPLPPFPPPVPPLPEPFPERPIFPFPCPPPWRFCFINLNEGCYRIYFTPNSRGYNYHGTMRVDNAGGGTTISGDLYRFKNLPFRFYPRLPRLLFPSQAQTVPLDIPVYARNQYYSYLKVTNIQRSPLLTTGPCELTLTIEEYVYIQPPAGSFNGSFPGTPSRTFTIVLLPQPAPAGFTSSYFTGKLFEGGIEQGSITMGWVSSFFRKAKLEIDTVTGATAPQPVTINGTINSFESIFNNAGWDLDVRYDQTNLADNYTNGTGVWSRSDLHALMESVRKPWTDLDTEWRAHLLCVPKIAGAWGVMYDSGSIDDPPHREGAATNSHAKLPDLSKYGSAKGKLFKDAPGGVYLRSATHEVGHIFNLYHSSLTSYGEPGIDATVMTGTANIASTSSLGQFPENIEFRFNDHDRHHLIHFPDPVVRPGAMNFGEGHSTTIPEVGTDRTYFLQEELELRVTAESERIKLGEPLRLEWTLTNRAKESITVPDDIGVEAQHAIITVADSSGQERRMPSFVIQTEQVSLQDLKPAEERKANTWVFWSSRGFAFQTPGKHMISVRIVWNISGIPCAVRASVDVWVDYPTSEKDNNVLSLLMHSEVGKLVALGGSAHHLKDAVSRIENAISKHGEHPACQCMAEFVGHKKGKSRSKTRG